MRPLWKICVMLSFVCFCFDAIGAASRVEIVLDVSGSMRAPMGDKPKIDAAKQAIESTIEAIEEGSIVALRFYGHRVEQQKRSESCRDTELVIPFEPIDWNRFHVTLDQAIPKGQTPIAYSLEQAIKDLKSSNDEPGFIIFVSDGEETCGGDPVEVACKLAKEGIGLTVHTVGFDVDVKTRRQLEEIARCTGGEYRDARNAESLAENLQGLTSKALLIEKRRSAHGQEIRGGRMHDDAEQIQPGTTYHLDHHQRKNEFDYFYFDVRDGQKISVSISTGERGVDIKGNDYREKPGHAYAGFELHDPERKKIAYKNIIGAPNQKEQRKVAVARGQGGRFYLLIGNNYEDQHQESRFLIELEDQYDANSDTDAGRNSREAIKIGAGKYTGYFSTNDVIDFYQIRNAFPITLRARPERSTVLLEMFVEDEDGKILSKARAPNDGATVKIEGVRLQGNQAFVKLTDRGHSTTCFICPFWESPYELEVLQVGGAAAVKSNEAGSSAPIEPSPSKENQNYVLYTLSGCALTFFFLTGIAVYFIRKKKP